MYVGYMCGSLDFKVCSSAVNSKGTVYLRQCKLSFQLSQMQGGSLLPNEEGVPCEPSK